MRFFLPAAIWLLASVATAAPSFPALTGRVVDNANLIGRSAERSLSDELAGHEKATGNQIVVVTLPDLGGYSIEEYGYQLGRHWGIGQKDKNNGVLLIVAKQERKVRIEVGYGLEGTLTDAMASMIIQYDILPAFRRGKFEDGIVAGTHDIIQALGGKYQPPDNRTASSHHTFSAVMGIVIFLVAFAILFGGGGGRGGFGRRGGFLMGIPVGGGGFGGGGFGGGGFSGGGGGFGGGGASGGW